ADFGLVIIDGNDAELKRAFIPVAEKEFKEEFVLKSLTKTNAALENSGYHAQVFVRECNLFFIQADGTRIRIIKENNQFLIGDKSYSIDEIVELLHKNPKQFSPNALLRPVYQELILPNLAYVGGGG